MSRAIMAHAYTARWLYIRNDTQGAITFVSATLYDRRTDGAGFMKGLYDDDMIAKTPCPVPRY